MTATPTRRALLAGGGALIVGFSLRAPAAWAQGAGGEKLPGDLGKYPMLDSWLRIDADGKITVFTGKAELGQGLKTALIQLAAEELVVAPAAIRLVTADTAATPNEGYTAGSHSMQDSGTAIRNAAAQVRQLLIGAAATRLQLPSEQLHAEGGSVVASDGRKLGYGELVGDRLLDVRAAPQSPLTPPAQHRLIGKDLPRVDIPAKVTGVASYVQDLRLPRMVHGRVVLPPSYEARLKAVDSSAVEHLPGVLKVVQDGSYLAVIAEREYQAVVAMRALAAAAQWDEKPALPDHAAFFTTFAALPAENVPVHDGSASMPPGARIRIEVPPRSAFDPALIAKGAHLAAIGDCAVCHTAPGGPAYAGNRAVPTPFGTIYSTNITPAPGNGIGHWSEAAFNRAMRRGISRDGHHLYPAFPYPHYTKVDDGDLHALYAFIMTRSPVDVYTPPNELPFPLSQRWLMPVWNYFFLDSAPLRPDPAQSAAWNRGRYLVEGLGHCGDCHTPRNLLGGEKSSQALAGGAAEGWRGPALDAASPAPVPWDEPHLVAYLSQGWDSEHGAAAGPMQEVIGGLAGADAADLRAIAAYLAAQQGEVSPARRERAKEALARAAGSAPPPPAAGEDVAAALFAGACAACHTGGAAMATPHGIDLALSTAVNESDPTNAIRIVLGGIRPRAGQTGPWMPGFGNAFTDDQVVKLLAYVRAHYSGGPAWPDLAGKLRDIREGNRR